MRIALVNAPLKSPVCDFGVGHQMPLGLLMIGGPLLDAGHDVTLIDAACDHLSDTDIVRCVCEFRAEVVMIAHVGSTPAHNCCLRVLRAVKAALPHAATVYGGVHPTYHGKTILAQHPEVDVIVRGEGEATALDLMNTLDNGQPLARVDGIVYRDDSQVVMNSPRATIDELDAWRIGWELIDDWDKYQAFGLGRAAVVQFSRGCPHTCTYCGQWMFWKRWRHRDVLKFVDELEWLRRERDVRFFWLADENPTTDKEVWKNALAEIARRELGTAMCASIRAQDIVRDADILHLYRQAGFLYILMGVETVTDENLARIRKDSCVNDAYHAVRLLRAQDIMSIVDYIFGIDDETPQTLWRGLRGLLRYDGDMVNALYMTPHAWTPLGREMMDAPIVEDDLGKWDYRHQVIGVKRLSPTQLHIGVKLVELVYHLHPRRLWRLFGAQDRELRRQLRFAFWHTTAVFWYEVFERVANAARAATHRPRGKTLQPRETSQLAGVNP